MEESKTHKPQKEPAQRRKRKFDTQENGLAEPERVKSAEDIGLKTGGTASNLMHEMPRLEKHIAKSTKINTREKP